MSEIQSPSRPRDLAREVLAALSEARQIPPFSERVPDFDLPMAYAVASDLRQLRGETVVGRKIGFTNRTIWKRYGVDAPMWGDVTEASVAAVNGEPIRLAPFCEPRLEPEVALRLHATPGADMDDAALLSCVEWFAPAFEIVQSIYPGWRFTLADCAAANGLHGRLLLGPPVPSGEWALRMPDMALDLLRGTTLVETGYGHNVLGGPLSALRHLVETLLAHSAPPLVPGEIITTGTLTDAWSLAPGETWTAHYRDSPLGSITARFA